MLSTPTTSSPRRWSTTRPRLPSSTTREWSLPSRSYAGTELSSWATSAPEDSFIGAMDFGLVETEEDARRGKGPEPGRGRRGHPPCRRHRRGRWWFPDILQVQGSPAAPDRQ